LLSLAETSDLDLVPARFAVTSEALFRAGLELKVLHCGLWLASLAVRVGWLGSLAPLARPFRALAAALQRFGSDRGGMMVEAFGLDMSGRTVRATWSLVAEGGDGPLVPSLPALAVLRALADGHLSPGASACVGLVSLEAIEAEFTGHNIRSSLTLAPAPAHLYGAILGAHFEKMPAAVRALHQPGWGRIAKGVARVEAADGRLGRFLAEKFGFPQQAAAVPVMVEILPETGRELWLRHFGDRCFASYHSAGRHPGRLIERFGPLRFELELLVTADGVRDMPVRAWWLGPVPLPLALAPQTNATESADAYGRFCFSVEIRLPCGLGRLVRYQGWLVVDDPG
jgi:hypothetical protein